MREELLQNESHSQSSKFKYFLKMFSFVFPLLDVIKLVIASVTSVVFMAFAGITFAGSAVALVVSTPIFIIFSPILVPATIATTLLTTGLTAGAALGMTAISLVMGPIGPTTTAKGVTSGQTLNLPRRLGRKRFSGKFRNRMRGGGRGAGGFKIPEWLKNMPKGGGGIPGIGGGGIPGMGGGGTSPAGEGTPPSGGTAPPGESKPPSGTAPSSGGTPPNGGAPASGGEPAGGSAPT
ncbi:hypothetical protein EUTSA_v10014560mg [Eutrema salsugineum]|uniref:Oleosin n=1 Tax=Eutrema salsugineum TaxID=72664 RepID=V4LLK0_EUTSA|nr:oleosin-B2 [Eutrema salsugineum]ESQ40688.1 hypothetical protein EUTSA_v10014560mg [Eutrema salsugineum]